MGAAHPRSQRGGGSGAGVIEALSALAGRGRNPCRNASSVPRNQASRPRERPPKCTRTLMCPSPVPQRPRSPPACLQRCGLHACPPGPLAQGALLCLAAAAVGLGDPSEVHLRQIVPPVLASFTDQDARVRYYACEALYNIAKVGGGPSCTCMCVNRANRGGAAVTGTDSVEGPAWGCMGSGTACMHACMRTCTRPMDTHVSPAVRTHQQQEQRILTMRLPGQNTRPP